MDPKKGAVLMGRKLEFMTHENDESWGYKHPQTDTFAVLYPKDYDPAKTYPLCVVFHSAGHDVYSVVSCVLTEGNHDIYHVPENLFGLYLDCRSHAWDQDSTDWFWGGRNAHDPEPNERSGVELLPVEKRCFATIDWMCENFPIDKNRIYGVGNSMGGTGALGMGLSHGDLFAALKINVPAGVYHAMDRCGIAEPAPEGFSIPEPPVVLDYSAQNDTWSDGHEHLYRIMREKGYALMGFWGNFGHENNHTTIAKYNDLVQAFDIFSIKKNEAYPAFTNASTDDKNPWENDRTSEDAGQVNGFFRWKVLSDTENGFETELRLLRPDEWESRLEFPKSSVADVTLRRLQNFKVSAGDTVKYEYGSETGTVTAGEKLTIEKLTVTQDGTVLKLTK